MATPATDIGVAVGIKGNCSTKADPFADAGLSTEAGPSTGADQFAGADPSTEAKPSIGGHSEPVDTAAGRTRAASSAAGRIEGAAADTVGTSDSVIVSSPIRPSGLGAIGYFNMDSASTAVAAKRGPARITASLLGSQRAASGDRSSNLNFIF